MWTDSFILSCWAWDVKKEIGFPDEAYWGRATVNIYQSAIGAMNEAVKMTFRDIMIENNIYPFLIGWHPYQVMVPTNLNIQPSPDDQEGSAMSSMIPDIWYKMFRLWMRAPITNYIAADMTKLPDDRKANFVVWAANQAVALWKYSVKADVDDQLDEAMVQSCGKLARLAAGAWVIQQAQSIGSWYQNDGENISQNAAYRLCNYAISNFITGLPAAWVLLLGDPEWVSGAIDTIWTPGTSLVPRRSMLGMMKNFMVYAAELSNDYHEWYMIYEQTRWIENIEQRSIISANLNAALFSFTKKYNKEKETIATGTAKEKALESKESK